MKREKIIGAPFLERLANKIENYRKNAKANQEDPYKGIVESLTMIDAFWILRLHHWIREYNEIEKSRKAQSDSSQEFDKLKSLLYKRNMSHIKPFFSTWGTLCEEIGEYYSNLIQKDYNNFVTIFMDELYYDYYSIQKELEIVLKDRRSNNDDKNEGRMILSRFCDIINTIGKIRESLLNQEQIILDFLKDINVTTESMNVFHLFYVQMVAEFSRSKYSNLFGKQKLPNRNIVNSIAKDLVELSENVKELTAYKDKTYQSAREIIVSYGSANSCLIKYFIWLEYLTTNHFNLEIILLFMFLDIKPKSIDSVKFIIEKHENLFLNILSKLTANKQKANVDKLLGFTVDEELDEINDSYRSELPPFACETPKILTFFRLKKILQLFSFYNAVSGQEVHSEVRKACTYFNNVLRDIHLDDTSFNYVLDYLPDYLKDSLGINGNNLAYLLNTGANKVSERKTNGKILARDRWFWQAVTGYSRTFFNGLTTSPYYGETDSKEDMRYVVSAATVTAYAEIIIKRIIELVTYEKSLAKKPSAKEGQDVKYTLSSPLLLFISRKAHGLVDDILESRLRVDDLVKGKQNSKLALYAERKNLESYKSENESYPIVNIPGEEGVNRKKEERKRKREEEIREKIERLEKDIHIKDQEIRNELNNIVKRLHGFDSKLSEQEEMEIDEAMKMQEAYEKLDSKTV